MKALGLSPGGSDDPLEARTHRESKRVAGGSGFLFLDHQIFRVDGRIGPSQAQLDMSVDPFISVSSHGRNVHGVEIADVDSNRGRRF
eukprot:3950189-Pyramimonas_sp.AAC.1